METKKNTVYRVDFNYPEKTDKKQADTQDTTNAGKENIKILLYGKGRALFLEPGTIKNTKLQFGDSNQSAKSEIDKLKNQGVNFIVCEKPEKSTATNIEDDFNSPQINKLSPSDRLKHLQDLGYTCIKP